jgi:hypothetical protein
MQSSGLRFPAQSGWSCGFTLEIGEFWGIEIGRVFDDKDGARRVIEPGMDTAAVLEVSARRLIKARCNQHRDGWLSTEAMRHRLHFGSIAND